MSGLLHMLVPSSAKPKSRKIRLEMLFGGSTGQQRRAGRARTIMHLCWSVEDQVKSSLLRQVGE